MSWGKHYQQVTDARAANRLKESLESLDPLVKVDVSVGPHPGSVNVYLSQLSASLIVECLKGASSC